ncbi:MAG: CxxC-x17-CxxC domain-containing protein [Candidatus Nanoarchaeia archaeon]|jgi:CxxC-x17-CxxC domain-containing protein
MDRKRSFKDKRQNSDRNDEDRDSSRSYGNRDGNRGFGNRDRSRSFGNNDGGFKREMHKAICAECGNECTVPFKPVQDKPVYCRDCFMKRKKF